MPALLSDTGLLTNMSALPVTKLHFGGLVHSVQSASFRLGALQCFGLPPFGSLPALSWMCSEKLGKALNIFDKREYCTVRCAHWINVLHMFNSYPTIRWRKYKVSGETKSRFPPSLYHPTRPASSAEATNAAHYYLSYVVSCKMDQFLSNKTYLLHLMSTLANRIFCSGLAWSSTPARTLIVSMHNKELFFIVFKYLRS